MVTSDAPGPRPVFVARLFDGRSGLAHPVRFTIVGDVLFERKTDGSVGQHAVGAIKVAEPLSHAPRLLALGDGSVIEVHESPALDAALVRAGFRDSRVVGWQRAWPASLVALILLAAASAWLYLAGLPMAADWAANHLPPSLEQRLGDKALAVLDRRRAVAERVASATARRSARQVRRFRASSGSDGSASDRISIACLRVGGQCLRVAGRDDRLPRRHGAHGGRRRRDAARRAGP
jgi:hypothetical protein